MCWYKGKEQLLINLYVHDNDICMLIITFTMMFDACWQEYYKYNIKDKTMWIITEE